MTGRLKIGAAVLLALYLAGRVAVLVQGKVFTSFDTFSYASRGDATLDRGPLVSFTGDAPRPWGVPLFYALFGSDQARAVAQWTLSTVAWALLAWALSRHLRTTAAQLLAIGGVLLLGSLTQVTSWDFTILSESLSLSVGVLCLAALLWWGRTRSTLALVGLALAGVWWTFVRVDTLPLLAALVLALVLAAWRLREDRRRLTAALMTAGVLVLAAGYSYLVVAPNSLHAAEKWTASPNVTHEQGLVLYRLRINVYPDPAVLAAFTEKLGMPPCPGAQELSAKPGWDIAALAAEVDKCPQLKEWTKAHEADLWTSYAKAAPGLFLRQLYGHTSDSLRGAAYAEVPAVVSTPVERLAFPGGHQQLPISVAALALTLALALFTRARREHPAMVAGAALLGLAALGSAVVTVALSAGETWRFGLQEALALRLAMLMLVCASVDAFAGARAAAKQAASEQAASDQVTSK